ncbi:MAG: hypothetical protein Fur0018_01000 [Anaerolineales bacterium]
MFDYPDRFVAHRKIVPGYGWGANRPSLKFHGEEQAGLSRGFDTGGKTCAYRPVGRSAGTSRWWASPHRKFLPTKPIVPHSARDVPLSHWKFHDRIPSDAGNGLHRAIGPLELTAFETVPPGLELCKKKVRRLDLYADAFYNEGSP